MHRFDFGAIGTYRTMVRGSLCELDRLNVALATVGSVDGNLPRRFVRELRTLRRLVARLRALGPHPAPNATSRAAERRVYDAKQSLLKQMSRANRKGLLDPVFDRCIFAMLEFVPFGGGSTGE